MDDEERWAFRILMITGIPVDNVFHASEQEASPSYRSKSRKIKGSSETNLINSIQPWGVPDTSQRDRPRYFPEPSKPSPSPPRDFRKLFLPPGYPPQLVPGIGLIPYVTRAMDWLYEGSEYHYDQPM